MKGVSASNLNFLWRCAVRIQWRGRCAFCGSLEMLDCHHIVHCKVYLLKWDVDNGILLCRECHNKADTLIGRELVKNLVGDDVWEYLKTRERLTKKQWLVDHGMSDDEFRLEKKEELNTIIKGGA